MEATSRKAPQLVTFAQFFKTVPSRPNDRHRIVVEMAGKDSIAAIVPVLAQLDVSEIICVGVDHRGFYGNFFEPYEHYLQIKQILKGDYPAIKWDFIYLDLSSLFTPAIVKPMAVIQKYFHYYSPCPACHLFLHMMRIPLLHHLGARVLVSGERAAHGSRLKLNQLPAVLDLFTKLMATVSVDLAQPLKEIADNAQIYQYLGDSWKDAQPYRCIFSGNYYDENNAMVAPAPQILDTLERFYFPLFSALIEYIEAQKKAPPPQWYPGAIQNIVRNYP